MVLTFSSPACGPPSPRLRRASVQVLRSCGAAKGEGGAERPRTCCGVSEAEGGPPALESPFSFLCTHMPVTLISIAFGLLLVTAAVTDFLEQRIPNWLVIAV